MRNGLALIEQRIDKKLGDDYVEFEGNCYYVPSIKEDNDSIALKSLEEERDVLFQGRSFMIAEIRILTDTSRIEIVRIIKEDLRAEEKID